MGKHADLELGTEQPVDGFDPNDARVVASVESSFGPGEAFASSFAPDSARLETKQDGPDAREAFTSSFAPRTNRDGARDAREAARS